MPKEAKEGKNLKLGGFFLDCVVCTFDRVAKKIKNKDKQAMEKNIEKPS